MYMLVESKNGVELNFDVTFTIEAVNDNSATFDYSFEQYWG